jgi:hypothetical protein
MKRIRMSVDEIAINTPKAKQKNMCVYGHMSKKSRVGRSALNFFLFFFSLLSAKPEMSFQNPIPVFHFRNFR